MIEETGLDAMAERSANKGYMVEDAGQPQP